MHPWSRNTLRFTLLLLIAILLHPSQSASAQTNCSFGSCEQSCSGLSSLPPQNPLGRSYDTFIVRAYQGAYGRFPTCDERQFEFWNLQSAGYGGSSALLEEAKRFVSTLFETQQSYDLTTSYYVQMPEYELRNAACRTDHASLEAFVRDLYKAFLQRDPNPYDLGGQCFWANGVCTDPWHRKHGIEAFKVSIDFGNLVNGLFEGDFPCDFGGGGGGGGECSPGMICQ